MFHFVRCPTCGLPIGDLRDVYELKAKRLMDGELKAKGVSPRQASADLSLSLDHDKIFDSLNIPRERFCCRMHMMTTISFPR